MTFKKIIIIFLLILSIFSFSSVHAENINVTSSSAERMQCDIDYLKQLLKNHNINNMNDLVSFFGANSNNDIQYFFIEDAGHSLIDYQIAIFYSNVNNISIGVDNYSYYGIKQNSFTLHYNFSLIWQVSGGNLFSGSVSSSSDTFTAPSCWLCVRTVDLFTKDSSQIVASAVENINDKLTEDNSNQNDINLGTHNDEMSSAIDSIKNSNLYSKFDHIIDEMDDAFTYNDDDVSILPITFFGKSLDLRSDEISSFFKNNNLGFVVVLWQSMLWFSLFYTMFLFIRKLYKAFSGGNPVDDVSSTLSSEDNKIVGGF